MSRFDEIRKRASQHDLHEKMIPGSKVARMRNYRNERGERVGLPAPPEGGGIDDITAGLESTGYGGLTGFGNYLVREGKLSEAEIKAASQTELPEGDSEVAIQDLAPDRTPGGGIEIDDEIYDEIREGGRRMRTRRTISQWEEDLKVMEADFVDLQNRAQQLENKGQVQKAALFDRKCQKLAGAIHNLKKKIVARKRYERDIEQFEDMPTGIL